MNIINRFKSSLGEKLILIFMTSLVNFLFYLIVVSIQDNNLKVKLEQDYMKQQLVEFYFPLRHALQKSELVWLDYKKRYKHKIKKLLTSNEILIWQKYMLIVFQPIHIELEWILKKSHLSLHSEKLETEIEIMLVHLNQFKVLFSQWKNNHNKRIFSSTNFPKKLLSLAELDIENLEGRLGQ